MKFTLSWLKQFLDTDYSVEKIAEALTAIGLEVEEIIDKRDELKSFEVAHIVQAKPHPSADKLKLCMVQTSQGMLQIVCGAANARENLKVVLAPIGSIVPNGKFKIKESTIRGEKSFGMLCSEEELLLSSESEGIIELPQSAVVGEYFSQYYGLDDPVFHINVTPNRGDALGVYGIARDLAAKGIGELKDLKIPKINSKYTPTTKVIVNDQLACSLFAFREIKNLKNKPSPEWLQKLLKNIGIKPISAIVDVTNYISYSFGQPMHAYDLHKLTGDIVVEYAMTSKFQALNGHSYKLIANDLIIRDDVNIQSLAGVIGSSISSCSLETDHILLEAACFDAKVIANSGRRLQIDTDSRHRFERNIDRDFTVKALQISSSLISTICESKDLSEVIIVGNTSSVVKFIDFPVTALEKITGLRLSSDEICDILNKLGFKTKINNEVILVTCPSWRHDINIIEDLVEEITRIYGYDQLPLLQLPNIDQIGNMTKEQKRISSFKRILATKGYDEVVTNSFMNNEVAKLFSNENEELLLLNPISHESNYMRPSIIPGLLKIAKQNLARSVKNMAFFEVGPIFTGVNPEKELIHISAIKSGAYVEKDAHTNGHNYDIFDIKADLDILFNYLGLSIDKCVLNSSAASYYHPTRSVSILLGKNTLGYFGQIHPQILKYFGINQEVFAFELDVMSIAFAKPKFGKRAEFVISVFQTNFRDYAFVLDQGQPVGEIINYINNFNKKLVKSVTLFDIYSGDKLPNDKKSIAIKVELQADDRTLNEQDLNQFSISLINVIEQKFQGKLRE